MFRMQPLSYWNFLFGRLDYDFAGSSNWFACDAEIQSKHILENLHGLSIPYVADWGPGFGNGTTVLHIHMGRFCWNWLGLVLFNREFVLFNDLAKRTRGRVFGVLCILYPDFVVVPECDFYGVD